MQTLHYAGTSYRISNELAEAVIGYAVALRHDVLDSTWLALPGYPAGSDVATVAQIQLVPNQPMMVVPTYPALPDASGSMETANELRKWSARVIERNPEPFEERTSEQDVRSARSGD
jgi:hypothetical protein